MTFRKTALILFFATTAVSGCASNYFRGDELAAAQIQAARRGETESPDLRHRISGRLIIEQPVGGINSVDLDTMSSTPIRQAKAGGDWALSAPVGESYAIDELSEPDEEGRVVYVTAVKGGLNPWRREIGHSAHLIEQGNKVTPLFTGPGEVLWDHAISPVSLAPRNDKVAFVAQPPENEGKRFLQLVNGPLRMWDPASGAVRDIGFNAYGERPSWFPDGRRLAYVSACIACPNQYVGLLDLSVHIVDTETKEDIRLAEGHLPLVSSDGRSVLVTRGSSFSLILIDFATRTETLIPRIHGLGVPLALVDSRYIIYKGRPTPGNPTGVTGNNSNFVGPKPMQSVKVMDLRTKQFATLVPLIDPRLRITALAHVAAVQHKTADISVQR